MLRKNFLKTEILHWHAKNLPYARKPLCYLPVACLVGFSRDLFRSRAPGHASTPQRLQRMRNAQRAHGLKVPWKCQSPPPSPLITTAQELCLQTIMNQNRLKIPMNMVVTNHLSKLYLFGKNYWLSL